MSAISKESMENIWVFPVMLTLKEAEEKLNEGSVIANVYFLHEYFFKEKGQLKLELSDKSNVCNIEKLPYANDSHKNGWIEIKN